MTLLGESFFFNSDSGGGVVKLDAGLARVLPAASIGVGHLLYYNHYMRFTGSTRTLARQPSRDLSVGVGCKMQDAARESDILLL